jgi:Cdc6-like AAA superfamily ATPase
MNETEQRELEITIAKAFSPAAPIDRAELLAGRSAQVGDLIDVIYQAGQHAVLYGERGVGKTSMARVTAEFLASTGERAHRTILAPRVNCDRGDNFASIWRKVLTEIGVTQDLRASNDGSLSGAWLRATSVNPAPRPLPTTDLAPQVRQGVAAASSLLRDEPVTPDSVRRALQMVSSVATIVIIIDEFDRMGDTTSRTLFADTIKALSDSLVPATVILVGVADDIDQLISEHQSTGRNLVQLHVTRLSMRALEEAVNKALDSAGMSIQPDALRRIALLSQGLPHYTHLVAQYAARAAVAADRQEIELSDVDAAVRRAVDRVQQSITTLYERATQSARGSLYAEVLLAGALARGDDVGSFAAVDISSPLRVILRRELPLPTFARHLSLLCGAERGPVLDKRGTNGRFRYRFTDSLMQPYVVLRGLASGMIDATALGA